MKKFKISYTTGSSKIVKTAIANSAKERDGILSFMRQRKDKDDYRNIKVTEVK